MLAGLFWLWVLISLVILGLSFAAHGLSAANPTPQPRVPSPGWRWTLVGWVIIAIVGTVLFLIGGHFGLV